MTVRTETPEGTGLVWLSRRQMVEVDRVMVNDLGIGLIQMMESAGRHLATLVRDRFLKGDPTNTTVVVLVGTGGNGGGGLVAARRLHAWGATVRVVLASPPELFAGTIEAQLTSVIRLGIPVLNGDDLGSCAPCAAILDAIVGYSLDGPLRARARQLAEWATSSDAPVVSLDVPSGLDATSGACDAGTVRPAATVTLAMPKRGLQVAGRELVGELYLADIGVPPSVYTPIVGRAVRTPFVHGDLVRVW